MWPLCGGPCPQCAVCHPWAAPLHSLCCDANLEPAYMQWAGSASMENRALPLHVAQKPTTQHGALHPRPFTLSHPNRSSSPPPRPHPTLLVPLCWLLLVQLIRSMRSQTMAVLSTRKPGMCLNVAGRVPLFSQSTLCVPGFPLREKQ